jgi:hypothetical protein
MQNVGVRTSAHQANPDDERAENV